MLLATAASSAPQVYRRECIANAAMPPMLGCRVYADDATAASSIREAARIFASAASRVVLATLEYVPLRRRHR